MTTRRSVLPPAVSELFISWMCHRGLLLSTYLTQVYDDTDWRTSRYQTLGREVQPQMIYVGIDIAKLNRFASAISSDGEILIEPFKFKNDGDGFQMLVSKLNSLNAEPDSIIIDLKSTAHYGDNLVRYLFAENFQVCVESHQDFHHTENNIRKTKTDKVDTYIIVKTLVTQKFLSLLHLLRP